MQNRRASSQVTPKDQDELFNRRSLLLSGAQIAVGVSLAGRMAYLTISEGEHFSMLAQANKLRAIILQPRRGLIRDRFGERISDNVLHFRVDLVPSMTADLPRQIDKLQKLLSLTDDDVMRIVDDLKRSAGFQPVPIAAGIDYETFARVVLRRPELPGVITSRGYSRTYRSGPAFAHLLGYVGAATKADLKTDSDPLLLSAGFKVGKQGLERMFDRQLRGEAGARQYEVTSRGSVVHSLPIRGPTPGSDIHLTINADLQIYLAERMGSESMSGAIIDCQNGDILAMASMPAFDPSSFSQGIGRQEWSMLSADDHLPLVNKALQGLYPAGSTVKPMNALAFLEAGVSPDETVTCTGSYTVGNSKFHCYRHGGHGPVNMHRAIQQSCDIYFYAMARRVGTPKIAAMARRLGLGQSFDLPVASQRFGTVPDPQWKERKTGKPWSVSDTLNSSIGQGYTLINPLQLAVMASRIASGRSVVPRLVHRPSDGGAGDLNVSEEHLKIVRRAMGDVVRPGGTASSAQIRMPGLDMAGKTGSAQVRRISGADRAAGRAVALGTQGDWKLRDHGLFIAFAPVDAPRYAAGFIHEHAGHGTFAAQLARDCFTFLYDKERAQGALKDLQRGWGGDMAERMSRQKSAWNAAHRQP